MGDVHDVNPSREHIVAKVGTPKRSPSTNSVKVALAESLEDLGSVIWDMGGLSLNVGKSKLTF